MLCRLKFLEYKEAGAENVSEDDWHSVELAQNLERGILAYRQAGLSTIFFSLFSTSTQGLKLPSGMGARETTDQSNVVQAMKQDAPRNDICDPIGGVWQPGDDTMHATHLYSWRQVETMEAIFGPGAEADIFSPSNGFFLNAHIEKALEQGAIANVPDVDLDPRTTIVLVPISRNESVRSWRKPPEKLSQYTQKWPKQIPPPSPAPWLSLHRPWLPRSRSPRPRSPQPQSPRPSRPGPSHPGPQSPRPRKPWPGPRCHSPSPASSRYGPGCFSYGSGCPGPCR